MSWTINKDNFLEIPFNALTNEVNTSGNRIPRTTGDHDLIGTDLGQYPWLPPGTIIEYMHFVVDEAFTSAGSATLTWGRGGAKTFGSSSTAKALSALTAGAFFQSNSSSWISGTSNQQLLATIGTAVFTAGKGRFLAKFRLT